MTEERRQYDRTDIFMIAEYRPFRSRQAYSIGITTDFSRDGFCFEGQGGDVKAGDRLEFVLKAPKGEIELPVCGTVVWKRDSWYKCVIGVEFLDLDEAGRQTLLETVTAYKDKGDEPAPEETEPEIPQVQEMEEQPEEHRAAPPVAEPGEPAETVREDPEPEPVSQADSRTPEPLQPITVPTDEDHVQAMRSASSAFRLKRRRKRPLRGPVIAVFLLLLSGIAVIIGVQQFDISPDLFLFSSGGSHSTAPDLSAGQIAQPSEPDKETLVVPEQGASLESEAVLPLKTDMAGQGAGLSPAGEVADMQTLKTDAAEQRNEPAVTIQPVREEERTGKGTASIPSLGPESVVQVSEPGEKSGVVNKADDKISTPAAEATAKTQVPARKAPLKKIAEERKEIKTPIARVQTQVYPAENKKHREKIQPAGETSPKPETIQASEPSLPVVVHTAPETREKPVFVKGESAETEKTGETVSASAPAEVLKTEDGKTKNSLPSESAGAGSFREAVEPEATSSENATITPRKKMPMIALVVTRKPETASEGVIHNGGETSSGQWSRAGRTSRGAEIFVDRGSIVWPARNTLRVRTMVVKQNQEFVDLLEIDCLKKMAHVPEGHTSANELLSSYSEGWKDISPESMPEIVSNATCPIDRQ